MQMRTGTEFETLPASRPGRWAPVIPCRDSSDRYLGQGYRLGPMLYGAVGPRWCALATPLCGRRCSMASVLPTPYLSLHRPTSWRVEIDNGL